MASFQPIPWIQVSDDAGAPLAGGKVWTYISGTTTNKTTYSDAALITPNTNPIILNARGEAQMVLGTGAYSLKLLRADDTLVKTIDGVTDAASAGLVTSAAAIAAGDALIRSDFAAATGSAMVGGAGQVVASIAALRSLLKTSPSKNAFVTGYYAAGDGGGGPYWYDATDTTTADNGGTVIVATDGGRWKLVVTGEVSARQFGAKGDGVTDDTTALQQWLDNSPALYLPNANAGQFYKITVPLVVKRANSFSLRGETREGATIKKIGVTASGEAAVLCPAGLAVQTNDVYAVDAVLIIKAPTASYNRDINIDKLTLKRDTKAGYGLYAPRISLSSFRNIEVYGADKGIYSASPWMINWTRVAARDCRANWILGDATATNGGGTSNTLLSCWAGVAGIGRVGYDCCLNYSSFNGCGADYMGYADDGTTTGPTEAIYKFTNSNVTMVGCGTEESRGPIVLATNSTVSIDGFHSYHYYGNWTGTYAHAFVALAGSTVSVRNLDVIMEGATITIKWGLSDGARTALSFYDNHTYPEINTYTAAATAPVTSGSGALRITNARHNYQSTSGGNGMAESLVTDGSFGANYGQGTWNTGHLLLGQWHIWIDAGIVRVKASAPTFTSDGSVIGAQT